MTRCEEEEEEAESVFTTSGAHLSTSDPFPNRPCFPNPHVRTSPSTILVRFISGDESNL
jgi:hypothetical protein